MSTNRVLGSSLVALVLVLLGSGTALAAPPIKADGSVALEDGTPVAAAQVNVNAVGSTRILAKAKTKKDGTFRMTFFPMAVEGVYTFRAEKDGLLMRSITVKLLRDGEVGAEYTKEIGAFQELHEFVIATGGAARIDLVMVPEDHFAKFLVIPGDKKSTDQLTKANVLSGEGRYDESSALLQGILESGVENANIYYLLGRNAFLTGETEQGVDWFEKTLALNPGLPGVYSQLGVAAVERGDHEAALGHFERELEIAPSAVVATSRAVMLSELGRDDQALEALEQVVEAYPGETAAYAELAALYLDREEADKAADALNRMESSGRPDPTLWYNIGANLSNRSKYEEAEAAYRRALELEPGFADAVRELGFLQIRTGNMEGALEYLDKYLETRPDAADAGEVRGLRDSLAKSLGK